MTYNYDTTDSQPGRAQKACQSVYGACVASQCGQFFFFHQTGALVCNCNVPVGQLEFIYENTGYTTIGQDYDSTSPESVGGQRFMIRRKNGVGCNSGTATWKLVQGTLEGICPIANGAGGLLWLDPGDTSNILRAGLACESKYGTCDIGTCQSLTYYKRKELPFLLLCVCRPLFVAQRLAG